MSLTTIVLKILLRMYSNDCIFYIFPRTFVLATVYIVLIVLIIYKPRVIAGEKKCPEENKQKLWRDHIFRSAH